MRPKLACELTMGEVFALTESGLFRDVWHDYHGYSVKVHPETGERVVMLVYTCALGYRNEIRADMPVWVDLAPAENVSIPETWMAGV